MLPYEIIYQIILYIDILDLHSVSFINRQWFHILEYEKDKIAKYFLDKYRVNYLNHTSFICRIYPYFKINIFIPYLKLLKVYMKYYKLRSIYISKMGITSLPLFPHLRKLFLYD